MSFVIGILIADINFMKTMRVRWIGWIWPIKGDVRTADTNISFHHFFPASYQFKYSNYTEFVSPG